MFKHSWLYVILVLPERNTELGQWSQAWGLLYFVFTWHVFTLGGTFLMSSCYFICYFIQSAAFHKSVCHHKYPVVVLASIYWQCFRSTSTYQVKSVLHVSPPIVSSKTTVFVHINHHYCGTLTSSSPVLLCQAICTMLMKWAFIHFQLI